MVDVRGDDGAAARDFVADELGRDVIGDAGAEALAVADIAGEAFAAEILALGDIFHLGRDDAAAGIMHLGDVLPRPGAQGAPDHVGEGADAAAAIRAELAVVLGPDLAPVIALDVAAPLDPGTAHGGEAGHDVDAGGGIGVRAAGVVDSDGRLAG